MSILVLTNDRQVYLPPVPSNPNFLYLTYKHTYDTHSNPYHIKPKSSLLLKFLSLHYTELLARKHYTYITIPYSNRIKNLSNCIVDLLMKSLNKCPSESLKNAQQTSTSKQHFQFQMLYASTQISRMYTYHRRTKVYQEKQSTTKQRAKIDGQLRQ